MAYKGELRDLRISLLPWRPGVVTAGQRTSIPETEAWKLKNGGPDFDGMVSKRPGLTQWGQTIKVPDSTATGSTIIDFADFLSDTSGFVTTDTSSGKVTLSTREGTLQTNVSASTGTEQLILSYSVPTLSVGKEWSVRFLLRTTNLEPYTAASTTMNTVAIRAQGDNASGKEFAFWSGGMYWKRNDNSQYTLVVGSEFTTTGAWNVIEIRCDDNAGNTTIHLNDALIDTLTSADLKDVSLTGTSSFEFEWQVEGASVQYSTFLSTPMYNDTITAPFVAEIVVGIQEYQYVTPAGTLIRSILAAAGDFIYHDKGLESGWRPLHAKQHANVFFAPYRTTVVWTDSSGSGASSVWQWDGIDSPTLLDDAPPVSFLTEHQQRLVAWGDPLNPRRLYYSGDRKPNTWFSPAPDNTEDQFDVLLDAGYLDIRSSGVAIRACVGDYYGIAVVAAEKGFWKMSGSGVFSYRLDGLKVGTGATNASSFVQVGNDVWSIAKQGLVSLSATEQFGDLQASFPSVPVQNLWNPDVSSGDTINKTFLGESRLVYSVSHALVVIAVPLIQDQSAQNIYVYNTNTTKLYGPWEVDTRSLAIVEVASPVTDVIMVGGSAGQIGYFNSFARRDFAADGYTLSIELPGFTGRSVNPAFAGLQKGWAVLRLYILPRGYWDYTITWWSDEDPVEQTTTRNQIVTKDQSIFTIDRDMRLDLDPDAMLASGETMLMHEIPLDIRGRTLFGTIDQTGTGEDLAIQGIEIDAVVHGYEGE